MRFWVRVAHAHESFEQLSQRVFGNVVLIIALLSLPALLLSLWRASFLGWHLFMGIQLLACVVLWGVVLLRERLSMQTRLVLLALIFFLFVTPSTLQLGPAAESRGFLMFLAFLVGLFATRRAVLWLSGMILLWVLVLALLAVNRGLPLQIVDFQAYSAQPAVWVVMAMVIGLFSGTIGYVGWALMQHLKQQTQALQLNEARLRGLFDLSPIGIALTDIRSGRFLEVNEQLLCDTGYSQEEFLQLDYWQVTPRDYETQEREQLRQLMGSGRFGPYEKELLRRDGSRFTVRVKGLLLTDAQGQRQIWSMVEDITEEKRLARMQREFVATVSHELRTPLTSITGALGLVSGGVLGELPDKARDMLEIARQNSQQLALLVNDLLDMEKLLAGQMVFNLQPQALLPLVELAVRNNQGYAEQHGVKLKLSSQVDAWVRVDALRLEQVLNNLLSNAAKFSPSGAEVEISIALCEGWARVSVQDHGLGIAPEFHPRVFDKFTQADCSDTRSKGGTGLGLAITRQLLERMGGRIDFHSRVGEGSTFYFELPLSD
ncbi:sensor histidine kinase [Aquipseudomonas guryensis]|jgi:PAS domain S-box-containing protein|uniref:histidine kinase n=1 Tax=Aquipseudomonas guryensis TaxID=2759165 RepID=A0A7W4H2F8_9GAMM|nr:ATP-binding protein [Pseudomonas guryensis]MBB1518528.1 PAS domain S-box protein [Pseudomonas guryensis]